MNEWFKSLLADDAPPPPPDDVDSARRAATATVRTLLASYFPSALLADVLLGLGLLLLAAYVFYRGARSLFETLRDAWHIVRALGRFVPRTLLVAFLVLVLYALLGVGADMLALSRADFPEQHRAAELVVSRLARATGVRST